MRKFNYKIMTVLVCLVMLVVMLTGCGAASVEKPETIAGVTTYEVTGNCNIEINGNVITVLGETDIMDGAVLNVSVVAQDGMVIDSFEYSKNGDAVSHDFTITDDKYGDVQAVVGYIMCEPKSKEKQPEAVLITYGNDFEYIVAEEGNYIWDKNGIIVLFASELIPLEK